MAKQRNKNNPSPSVASNEVPPQEGPALPDYGTPELALRCDVERQGKRAYVRSQLPIDYLYHTKRCLLAREYHAAQLLYSTFVRSGILPAYRPIAEPSTGKSTTRRDSLAEGAYMARLEVRQALDAIAGGVGKLMVENVVLYGFELTRTTFGHYHHAKAKLPRLREALNDLADFYDIPSDFGGTTEEDIDDDN